MVPLKMTHKWFFATPKWGFFILFAVVTKKLKESKMVSNLQPIMLHSTIRLQSPFVILGEHTFKFVTYLISALLLRHLE